MNEQQPPEGVERVEIVHGLPPSAQGTYEYERRDGTTVHGDASGEWTLDENGDVEESASSPPRAGWATGGRPNSGAPFPLTRCSGVGAYSGVEAYGGLVRSRSSLTPSRCRCQGTTARNLKRDDKRDDAHRPSRLKLVANRRDQPDPTDAK